MPRLLCLAAALAAGLTAFLFLTPTPDTAAKPDDKPRKAWGIDTRRAVDHLTRPGLARAAQPVPAGERLPQAQVREPARPDAGPGTKRLAVAQQHGQGVHVREPPRRRRQAPDARRSSATSTASPFTRSSPRTATSTSPPSSRRRASRTAARCVRFKVKQADPPEADPASEKVILDLAQRRAQRRLPPVRPRRLSLHRAPATAAASPTASRPARTSTTCSASILRIDVDKPGRRARTTRIPKDNPFVEHEGRPAGDLGLRHPAAVEVQLRHARPATCGPARSARTCGRWSTGSRRAATTAGASRRARTRSARAQEGADADPDAGRRAQPRRVPLASPAATSTTATRLPELKGAYIYGDYDTGRVWALQLRRKAKKVTDHRELADTHAPHRRLGRGRRRRGLRARLHRRRHLPARRRPRRRRPTRRSSRAS